MNRMKKFVAFVSSLSLAVFLLMLPFAWVLRDGLVSDAYNSFGLKAVVKNFEIVYGGLSIDILREA